MELQVPASRSSALSSSSRTSSSLARRSRAWQRADRGRGNGLRVAATDLEVGARVTVPATVGEPGDITLAARSCRAGAGAAPVVRLKLHEDGWVEPPCWSAAIRLVGLPADEYPPFETAGDAGGGSRSMRRRSGAC